MLSWIDLTGKKAGTLIAKEYLGNSRWRCICSVCGNEAIITTDWFRKLDRLERAGCKHQKPIQIGEKYGFLTVLSRADDYVKPSTGHHEKQWLCRCVCGRNKVILQSNLKANKSLTCGMCSTRVSLPEKAILFYLKKSFNNVEENYRPDFLNGKEIDVFIPEIKLGIEYDGERWHSEVEDDKWKDEKCKANGVRLIRIREPNCPRIEGSIITPKPTTNGTHMTQPILTLLDIISRDYSIRINKDVDCRRDNAEFCKTLVYSDEGKSLAKLHPEIAKEWDYEKNYPLTPNKVAARSGRKAWWLCPKGHSYSSVIASRTGKEACGCPICSGIGSATYLNGEYIGEHSLAKERPDVAAEFMEERNGITADKISVSSNKKMWFKCSKCGYEWQSKVNNRTSSNNQGCYKCGREKVRLSRCKPVICVETGVKYESATDAGRKMDINHSKISSCCRGEQETSGRYHWRYLHQSIIVI